MSSLDRVARFLHREAACLDNRQWEAWLDMFLEEAVIWMPAWVNEEELTADPHNELSLLYLNGKGEIQDRVFRIETGDSFASFPLDRTIRITGNIVIEDETANTIRASCNWLNHAFGQRGQRTLAGSTRYELVAVDDGFRILGKVMKLIDDRIDGPIDIYHIG